MRHDKRETDRVGQEREMELVRTVLRSRIFGSRHTVNVVEIAERYKIKRSKVMSAFRCAREITGNRIGYSETAGLYSISAFGSKTFRQMLPVLNEYVEKFNEYTEGREHVDNR